MAKQLPHASTVESLRFTSQVVLPNVIQGLFRRRAKAVAVATKADVDKHAVRFMQGLRHKHGKGPLWARVIKDQALVLLDGDDVRRVLEGSPKPFAADPDAKKRGMSHFQPDGLTISRGETWENRRRFAEAVLDTTKSHHRMSERIRTVCGEETAALLAEIDAAGGTLGIDPLNEAVRRITRRVVLGDSARDDSEVSALLAKLMDEANSLPKERSESFDRFTGRMREYVTAAEPGSLVGLFAEAPSDDQTRVEGQAVHWMFALGDTLPINALRALALLASHPAQRGRVEEELAAADGDAGLDTAAGVMSLSYLEACLEEAMRLWPTTLMLARETVEEVQFNGEALPVGTQIMIVNTFFHRDEETHDYANRFAPEAWTEGSARDDWTFNHFSHGPQGCPGAWLALFVGKAVIADIVRRRRVDLQSPKLDPSRPLPYMLNYFAIRLGLEAKPAAARKPAAKRAQA
jgi:cytochrome P450